METTRTLWYLRLGIAAALALALVVTAWMLFGHEVPDANREAVSTLLGGEITAFATVVNWAFGSSSGSARAHDRLAEVLAGQQTTTINAETAEVSGSPVTVSDAP